MGGQEPIPQWWECANGLIETLAEDLRAEVDRAKAETGRDGRRQPASVRSLAERLFVGKSRVSNALNGIFPADIDERFLVDLVQECRRLCGAPLTSAEVEDWRFRIRTVAAAVAYAKDADHRLARGRHLPAGRSPGTVMRLRADSVEVIPISRDLMVSGGGTPPDERRKRRRWLPWAIPVALVALLATTAVAFGDDLYELSVKPELLALMRESPACAENIPVPADLKAGAEPYAWEEGPKQDPRPDRTIELHFSQHPRHGWIAWIRLERSASDLDELWYDGSYLKSAEREDGEETWRQCGPFLIGDGKDTNAALVNGEGGRPRFFRACGAVPVEEPAGAALPKAPSNFCTGWQRPPGL